MEIRVRDDGTLVVEQGQRPFRAAGAADMGSLYAEGGLFGTCKQHPILLNAMVGPIGFERVLRWLGTDVENDVYQALTYIGTTGTSQASDCADCGKPVFRRCAQSACFGRICQMTNELLIDDIGLRANQNVPRLALFGAITDAAGNVLVAKGQEITDVFALNVAAAGYNLRLDNSTLLWIGNPANNLGGRAEYAGFDLLINTGKADVGTGIACDALDSYLLDFGSNVVGMTNSPSIVAYLGRVLRQLQFRANRANFSPITPYIVMHPNLWESVASAWACEYGLVCQTGSTVQNDGLALADLRNRFLNEMYLPIDGKNYPVVLDSQINYTMGSLGNVPQICSDIYVITTEVDGMLVTFGEYQDLNKTAGATVSWFRRMFGATHVALTDGGRYAVAPTTSGGFCFDVRVLTKPRIRMIMPWLSGRLQNVCVAPIGGAFPDVTGSGGIYALDGGATTWPPNYLYGDCWPLHVGS